MHCDLCGSTLVRFLSVEKAAPRNRVIGFCERCAPRAQKLGFQLIEVTTQQLPPANSSRRF